MNSQLMTSLAEIKSFKPCPSGWKNILKGQNKTFADGMLFSLVECVESNSISDVCWLLGKRKIKQQIFVLFAQKCANSVAHLKNLNAADAAYAAADAAAYAAYAAYAYAAADAAADAAAYAAYAAADAADADADAAAYAAQQKKNKQFLRNAINNWSL